MAYPSFVGASAFLNVLAVGGGATDLPKPSGVAAGHFLCIVRENNNNSTASALSVPSGFVLGGKIDNTAFAAGAQWWWKIAGESEPAFYAVEETASACAGPAAILAWAGVSGTPIDVTASSTTGNNNVTTISLVGLTTTVDETLYIVIPFDYNNNTATITASGSNVVRASSSITGRTVAVLEEQIATAGAVSGKQATSSLGTADFYQLAFAIAPAGGGPPPSSIAPISAYYSMMRNT